MRGGALPPTLLSAALGFALAFAPPRSWAPGVIALAVTAFTVALTPLPPGWLEGVFLGCWVSVVAIAATVYLARRVSFSEALVLSLNAGLWCGGVVALQGSLTDLLKALPVVLVLLPGAWMVHREASIVVKVVSSWIIAVAVLAAALQLLPVTPGYLPDHIE